MLACLRASAPPTNASPRIARMIDLYFMSRHMSALPDPGGLLDQRADVYAYFSIFAAAVAEHQRAQQHQ
jgi:hypothetical protein